MKIQTLVLSGDRQHLIELGRCPKIAFRRWRALWHGLPCQRTNPVDLQYPSPRKPAVMLKHTREGAAADCRADGDFMGRILVVDDSEDICHALARLLRQAGHDVDAAYDGVAALESARAGSPELIILDIMMPKMDGLEVLSRLKADDATAAVPVVMFSAVQDAETVGRALQNGAIDFWLKASFNFSELRDRVRTLMKQTPA